MLFPPTKLNGYPKLYCPTIIKRGEPLPTLKNGVTEDFGGLPLTIQWPMKIYDVHGLWWWEECGALLSKDLERRSLRE